MLRTAPLILALLAIAVSPAAAQVGATYCNVTAIECEQLSNGVRVTIVADGELEWDFDWEALLEEGAAVGESTEWGIYIWGWTDRFRRIPLCLWNARSKLGAAFVPIGKYPVSHAEIRIPPWAHEGVGLEVDIVNYLGWQSGEFHLRTRRGNWELDQSEDSNSIFVHWESDRFPPPPPPETPEDLPSELDVTVHDGAFDIRAVNAKLQDVANVIAAKGSFPIAAPADSDLRVSLNLLGVSPTKALTAIATASGLCARACPDGGWVIARPTDTAGGYAASESRTISLHHLRAEDALDLLPEFLLQYLHANRDANSIMVTGPGWLGDRVAEDLAKLDTQPPEVLLDVLVVEYTEGAGIARALSTKRDAEDIAAALDALTGDLSFLRLDGLSNGWDILVDALETETSTHLRSRTTVRVLNGRRARIFAGDQRYVILESVWEPGTAELERIETGTSLYAQPLLGHGDDVLIFLDLSTSALRGTDPSTGLPTVAVRNVYGSTRARDAETILVGGLESDEQERQDRAIPLLSSIPAVGSVFRAPDRAYSQTRLAIFITPHIIRTSVAAKGEANHG